MSETPTSKKRGRPKQYEGWSNTERGAPRLAVRLSPEVYRLVTERSEGPRAYIERLVTDDNKAAESTSPEDVPGQLLLNGQPQKVRELDHD